jgi:hypothetical protein
MTDTLLDSFSAELITPENDGQEEWKISLDVKNSDLEKYKIIKNIKIKGRGTKSFPKKYSLTPFGEDVLAELFRRFELKQTGENKSVYDIKIFIDPE